MKSIVFLSLALSLSLIAKAQTTSSDTTTQTIVFSDDDMDSDSTMAADTMKVKTAKEDNKLVLMADFGGAAIYNTANGATTTAPGLTWALSGQYAYQFKVKSKRTRLFLSVGLEVRNFNGTLSAPDGVGSTAYDNYHYWYAGIPVVLQVVDVQHKIGNLNDIGFYAQAGISLGFKADMLDVSSTQGNNSWNDISGQYTTAMVNGMLSAGVAYKTKCGTYLLGPYAGYVADNISKNEGVKENILSYGVRLTALLFK